MRMGGSGAPLQRRALHPTHRHPPSPPPLSPHPHPHLHPHPYPHPPLLAFTFGRRRSHLAALCNATAEGVNVSQFYAWSFLDNFGVRRVVRPKLCVQSYPTSLAI
jgi:hypothetical protein